jgi:hypothetical protein
MRPHFLLTVFFGAIVLSAAFFTSAQESISTEESGSTETISSSAGSEVQEASEQTFTEKSSRENRKNGIMIETPWNGLVGLGLLYTIRPVWPLAIEGGIGLSSMGLKYGIRGRFCFINKNLTPFFGMGYMQASGGDNVKTTVNYTTVTYDLKPISFVQITGGMDIVTSFGLTFLLATGWAAPLNDGLRNVKYGGVSEAYYIESYGNAGDVSSFKSATDLLYRGGLVLSFGIGFSF